MRKFTDKEKELIRSRLMEKGRQLFSVHGLKKTSVADLTKSAGIAQGSFYMFFASKEELYLEILQLEEQAIRSRLLDLLQSAGKLTRPLFKRFLRESFAVMETHPLIRQLYDNDSMETLFRGIPEEKLKEHFDSDTRFFIPIFELAQQRGVMIQAHPETIVSLLRSLVLLALQKRHIGEDKYEDTIELLIRLVADGLIAEEEETDD